jgi:osmoprotectant transport system permease protein
VAALTLGASKDGALMDLLADVLAWFIDADNWQGSAGIPNRSLEHIRLSALATAVAAALAVPSGVLLGHSGRGGLIAVSVVNIGRAIPSFAIIALALPFSIRTGLGIGFWPTFLALVLLALPPIFTNSYTAVRGVAAEVVEAARGMGMREREVLLDIELRLGAPLILTGIRVAAVQVVATATLGALVGWGGLGRYIIDGFSVQDNVRVFAGALLVAALAILTDVVFGVMERILLATGGLRGRRASARMERPA